MANKTLEQWLESIAAIPAPSFHEQERAAFVQASWQGFGLPAEQDGAGNVLVRFGEPPYTALTAHLDTVFPTDQHRAPQRQGEYLVGSSVGDNSSALAVVTMLLQRIAAGELHVSGSLLVCANVGEEGLGDLKGIRHLVDEHRQQLQQAICLDGRLGEAVNAGVGSERLRVRYQGPGGHSWGRFGSPSAIHALGRAIAAISQIEVPRDPRTSYNVGVISGGASVNTIAETAEMLVDMRSIDASALRTLRRRVDAALEHGLYHDGITMEVTVVGQRPTGMLEQGHPLVQTVCDVLRRHRYPATVGASSTDANYPLSVGLPAVTMGICRAEGAHTAAERVELGSLPSGLQCLTDVLVALSVITR